MGIGDSCNGGDECYVFEEVLPDYFHRDPELIKFYSLILPSCMANEFLKLSSQDNFTSQYPHIKRMRKLQDQSSAVEMIIGNEPHLRPELETFLVNNNVELVMNEHFIPKAPPCSKEKHTELSKKWPLNYFKPKWNPEVLSDEVRVRANKYIRLAEKIGRDFGSRGCIIELNGKIAAVGVDSRTTSYPWMHSFISAVNNFSSRLVSSGHRYKQKGDLVDPEERNIQDFEEDLKELGFGLKHEDVDRKEVVSGFELKNQYLCTNCIVYLSHEPCISCSMALVHSRVSKVFYLNKDSERGFLGSRHKLHCIPELNHHYRVFRVH